MACYLYFLPGVTAAEFSRDGRIDRECLKVHGLHGVFADVALVPEHVVTTPTDCGPDKAPGLVVVAHPSNAAGQIPLLPAYHPASQTWGKPGRGESEAWIGYQNDSPPTPEDLQRRDTVGGYRRPDRQDRSWVVPIIRGKQNQYGHLPVDYDWSAGTFEPGMILRSQFEALWRDSARIWDHLYLDGYSVPEEFVASFVGRCFAVNYRVGPYEFDLFRKLGGAVFDRESLNEWAALACDYPAVLEYATQKKITLSLAAASGTCSTAGDPAGTVDSSLVAASCE